MSSSSQTNGTSTPPIKIRYIALPSPLPPKSQATTRITALPNEGYPCRRCLQDAKAGEEIDLLAYDPFPPDAVSPYRGKGPIFVHAEHCEAFSGDSIPERQLQRSMAVRAYDEKHMMVAFKIVEGPRLEGVSGEMLADAKARYIHVHNAGPGCFAFKVERA